MRYKYYKKIIKFVITRFVFFSSSPKCTKTCILAGLRPGLRWGAYDAPRVISSRLSRRLRQVRRLELGAYGTSVLMPLYTNPWLRQ